MLHLRKMGLLNLDVMTVSGQTLGENLDWWEQSERRQKVRTRLTSINVDPNLVIMDVDTARREGLNSTVIFPSGNIAPDGAVIKATSIDPSVVDADNVYRHRGTARVFTSEQTAIQTIKGRTDKPLKIGEVIVLMGIGPMGTGMEEIYQITSALKFIPSGKYIPVITDGRFSGVSTGACIGHVGPEALAGGPISKIRDGDLIEIEIDRTTLNGHVDFVGTADHVLTPVEAALELAQRESHPDLHPHAKLPDDTRLWAALQEASGGTWAGCVYDVDKIIEVIRAGLNHIDKESIQNR
jgi:dihydroxyacid dehydratase/phosphogluconate dehydratase